MTSASASGSFFSHCKLTDREAEVENVRLHSQVSTCRRKSAAMMADACGDE
jgi:hypothetical protein